jgi:hypothetical protein
MNWEFEKIPGAFSAASAVPTDQVFEITGLVLAAGGLKQINAYFLFSGGGALWDSWATRARARSRALSFFVFSSGSEFALPE